MTEPSDQPDPRIELMLANIDRAYDRRSFHGTTLRGALRGLKVDVAVWKPAPDRNSIWQLILHAAYWKYIVRRSLTEDTKARFARSPSNFPRVPESPTPAGLKRDIALLGDEHRRMRAAVATVDVTTLERPAKKRGPTRLDLILGIAAHDLYHTGQIQLLKRLYPTQG